MICSRRARWCAVALLLAAGLCGCLPGGDSQADEEREPHFLMGRKLTQQMDYTGAVDAYEQALLVNPQSAPAHFELAWLYEVKQNDPAAAIYHYQRFLKLAPGSGNADTAREHINNCKLELAKTASAIAPISASAQRDLENLLQENRDLKAQLAQWQAFYAAHPISNNTPAPPPPAASNNPVAPNPTVSQPRAASSHDNSNSAPVSDNHSSPPAPARTHTVASGETMAAIARKYGVSVPALQNANPQVEPRRMRPGTVLNIPAS